MVKQYKQALIVVDLQNDFCPGGQLAVPEGDVIVPVANRLQASFELVVATQDWHPKQHTSFETQHPGLKCGDIIMVNNVPQILWPEHCVQGSVGAEFHPDFDVSRVQHIVLKGVDAQIDSYSAFFDNAHLRHTGLEAYLRERGVEDIYLIGLATDYCVKYTCLDALQLGFNVSVVVDGCRGVELQPGDVATALSDMREAGATLIYDMGSIDSM